MLGDVFVETGCQRFEVEREGMDLCCCPCVAWRVVARFSTLEYCDVGVEHVELCDQGSESVRRM